MVPIAQAPLSIVTTPSGVTPASSTLVPPGASATAASDVLQIGGDGASFAGSSPTPFADLVTGAVGQVGQLEQQARSAVEGLMTGTGVDVHEAMIATEKADMGFELMLSVRNKALAAYQQVMGMQF
jgi:flagellar hook-basal body complex protein FliE